MTVLVTGGTGFLGSTIIRILINEGHSVIILKRSTSNTRRINDLIPKVNLVDLDIIELDDVFQNYNFDCIIHTATSYGRNNEMCSEVVETNLLFPLRLLDYAKKYNVKYFINSDTFFDRFFSPYSLAKSQINDWGRISKNVIFINMIIHQMYGPDDSDSKFIPFFIKSLIDPKIKNIPLSPGKQLRDFIFVTDVASAFLAVLNNLETFKEYTSVTVSTGVKTTLFDCVNKISELFYALYPNEIKKELGFGMKEYIVNELMDIENDNSFLHSLGWKSDISLESGLKKTIEFYFNN